MPVLRTRCISYYIWCWRISAVNGIAGSYAERIPVIAITGAPTRAVVEHAGKYVHHSLGEGTF